MSKSLYMARLQERCIAALGELGGPTASSGDVLLGAMVILKSALMAVAEAVPTATDPALTQMIDERVEAALDTLEELGWPMDCYDAATSILLARAEEDE